MTKPAFNPFIYGKPVPIGRFIGRQSEVYTVFSRLNNGESTAIVGEPHIGKTSLLNYIVASRTRSEYTETFERYAFTDFDGHLLGVDTTPKDFWQQVVAAVADQIEDEAVREECRKVTQKDYNAFGLESLFKLIGKRTYHIALLIDEFDTLLDHPTFGQTEFLAGLRSFATRTDGLSIITASRLTVAQMNRKSQYHSPTGSPFFNNMIDVRLPHLRQDEAQSLLADTISSIKGGTAFEPADSALAYSLAGRHPFLLQIAGASLFDAVAEFPHAPRAEVHARVKELFGRRAEAHFDHYWRTLDEADQRTALMLALIEQSSLFDQAGSVRQQLGPLSWFEGALRHLAELGAVKYVDGKAKLTVGGFRDWMMDKIVYGARFGTDFAAWLRALAGQNLLSDQEIKGLLQLADRKFATKSSSAGVTRHRTNIREQHLETQLQELQRQYDSLTKRIAELDSDLSRELDSERKLTLGERRANLVVERDQVFTQMQQLDDQAGA